MWDKKSNERQKIVNKLTEEFEGWGLGFKLGGQISIDITRKKWDKTYAFEHISIDPKDCVFFGDKIVKGGNDYTELVFKIKNKDKGIPAELEKDFGELAGNEIAMLCGKHHKITSPADTLKILSQYIRI